MMLFFISRWYLCVLDNHSSAFFNDENYTKIGINSVFLKDKWIIGFNETWIESANHLEIQITCFHETRHAFQYLVVTGKYKGNEKIDQQTINQWKQDIANYEQPSGVLENDEDYLKQEIEIDAIAFAHKHMYDLYGVRTVIPDIIKHRIKST